MRFLIPNFSPPDTFVDNVTYTLKSMGHEVINLGAMSHDTLTSPYRRIIRQARDKITGNLLTPQEKWLRKSYREIKPDVVLTLTQALDEETLHLLKKENIKTVAWWGDTAANMKNKGLLQNGWDLIFIKDAYAAEKLKMVGLPAYQLLEAMNPAWHKPVTEQENNNLIIAGSFYDYRHFLVNKLMKDGVQMALYGGRLPRWGNADLSHFHTGKYIVREEKSKVFGAGLAVLNSTAMSEFDSVNCRAFEAAGCGSLHIMEYRSSIETCFEPGKEIVVYKSYEELLEWIERAISYPQEMKKIREAGVRRALTEHTYRHRLEVLLQKIGQL